MKKFLSGDVPFGMTTILFLTYTIYGIFTRDEFSLLSVVITFCFICWGMHMWISTERTIKSSILFSLLFFRE